MKKLYIGTLVLLLYVYYYIEEIRKNLLEYCKMDTLAMVRIMEKLEMIGG